MIRKKTLTLTTSAGGAASGTLGLGATYARIVRVKFATTGDQSSDYTITDGDGDTVFVKAAIDSDPGYDRYLHATEAAVADQAGEDAADGESGPAPVAKSPLTVTIANGGNALTHTVKVWEELSYH